MTGRRDDAEERIGQHAKRMRHARERPGYSPLRGLGTFGMIGWGVAVPAVGGAFLGTWLDRIAPRTFSWTLALIIAGVMLGSAVAWAWVKKEGGDE